MKAWRITYLTAAILGSALAADAATTVFEDDFANGIVTDSKSTTGFWDTLLSQGAGDANALNEAGGILTMTAGSTNGNDAAYSGVVIRSDLLSDFNFFTQGRVFSVRGITFDDHGTSIPDSSEVVRCSLISDNAGNAQVTDDAIIVRVTADGAIRLGSKVNEANSNIDGTEVHTFSGLGTTGPYGFDLRIAPAEDTDSQEYRLEVYTGSVPVSVGVSCGRLSITNADWGVGSGQSRMLIRTCEHTVTEDDQYFDATVSRVLVQSYDNLLFNSGFELGDTSGWEKFGTMTTTIETTPVYEGTYSSLVADRINAGQNLSRPVGDVMATGVVYTASIRARLTGMSSASGNLVLRYKVDGVATSVTIATATLVDNAWTLMEGQVSYSYSGSLEWARIYIAGVPHGATDMLLDDASLSLYIPQRGTLFKFN